MVKILIAEDHDFTRQGLVFGLNRSDGFEVIGEAQDGKEAVTLTEKLKPDMVLMDIGMPIMDGITATKLIKQLDFDTKVLVFTSHKDRANVLKAFNSGADAYCVKNLKMSELVETIKAVEKGAMWIDPSIAAFMLEIFTNPEFAAKHLQMDKEEKIKSLNITSREKEIIKLIVDGKNNKEICDKLFLSMSTVKNHVSNIIKKLAVNDRTQVALMAIKESLV